MISEPEGRVTAAPTSALVDSLPWCGLFPSNPKDCPSQPFPLQSNNTCPVSGESNSGSWIETPEEPSTRISSVAFSRVAPGAKFNIQSALALEPFIASAPVAFSKTHPVSSDPALGQIVPSPDSCALTNGADRSGPIEDNNIITTSSIARVPALAGPKALLRLSMKGIPLQWYINQMLPC